MLTYFLGDLTVYIYINVGNSQEGSEYDSYHNVKLGPEPYKEPKIPCQGSPSHSFWFCPLSTDSRAEVSSKGILCLTRTPNRLASF